MSDGWEVVATARADYDPPLIVSFLRHDGIGSEAFRITWPDGTEVEFPAYAFASIQQVCRGSYTLPVDLFGDTGELVRSLERLIAAMERSHEATVPPYRQEAA